MSDSSPDGGSNASLTKTWDMAALRWGLSLTVTLVSLAGLWAEINDQLRAPELDRLWWVPVFSLSHEKNVPTWVSSLLLFSCAALLFFHSTISENGTFWKRRYRLLSTLFLYISLDEFIEIHEHMSDWFHLDGPFYFGWVIPASFVVVGLGALYVKFLAQLPKRTRVLFVLSACLYVGGALGTEFFLGYWTDNHGKHSLGYRLIDWVQETMELTGVSLFLYALVDQLQQQFEDVKVVLRPPPRGLGE